MGIILAPEGWTNAIPASEPDVSSHAGPDHRARFAPSVTRRNAPPFICARPPDNLCSLSLLTLLRCASPALRRRNKVFAIVICTFILCNKFKAAPES